MEKCICYTCYYIAIGIFNIVERIIMTLGMSLAPVIEHVDPWCTNAQAYRGYLRLFSVPVIFCTLTDKTLRTHCYTFYIT